MDENELIFDFERLEVYQKAIRFSNAVFQVTSQFRQCYQFSLGEQMRRAALSICNNLAEGSGKMGKGKNQFYSYALDSARECTPIMTISADQKLITPECLKSLRKQCIQITSMLFRLIRSIQY